MTGNKESFLLNYYNNGNFLSHHHVTDEIVNCESENKKENMRYITTM